MVGREDLDEVEALKRVKVNTRRKRTFKIDLEAPEASGEYEYSILLVSDTYLGLDQQYEFTVIVE